MKPQSKAKRRQAAQAVRRTYRRRRHGPVDWPTAREQLQSPTPVTRDERLAVLRVRAQASFTAYLIRADAVNYGALNTVLLALQIESAKS